MKTTWRAINRRAAARIAIAVLAAATFTDYVQADALTPDEALVRAMGGSGARKVAGKAASKQYRHIRTVTSDKQNPEIYLFQSADKGYLVLSADDEVTPILGYSPDGDLTKGETPVAFDYWVQSLADEIAYGKANGIPMKAPESVGPAVEPLIKSKWGQDKYYDKYTPTIDGKQCVTGCVATAMAQLMYYHQWPDGPTGSVSYKTGSGFLIQGEKYEMDFNGVIFEWDKMSDTYDSNSSTASIDAVSRLMQCSGYGAHMNWGVDGSGTSLSNATNAFIYHFNYSPEIAILDRNNFNNNEWEKTLHQQLNSRLPIIYDGYDSNDNSKGHAFICDGYDGKGYFHINWGWEGACDGYFILSNLYPDKELYGEENYNFKQKAVINIYPNNGYEHNGIQYLSIIKNQYYQNQESLLLQNEIVLIFESVLTGEYEVGFKFTTPFNTENAMIKSLGTFSGRNECAVNLKTIATELDKDKVYDMQLVWKPALDCEWQNVIPPVQSGENKYTQNDVAYRIKFTDDNWQAETLHPAVVVEIDKTTTQMVKDASEMLTATVGPDYSTEKDVVWSTTNPDVATVDIGTVTAVGAGECDIVATTHNGLTASCHVTVVVNPDGITLDAASKEIYLGETFTLTATVSPDDATDKTVTWASSNNDIASVDANGQVTAKWVGAATITATTINGLAATCNVKVQPVLVESIALSQTSIEGNVGTEVALTATISPTNATYKDVTWSSDNPDVASVNESGTVTLRKRGTATITATASDGSGKSTQCAVSVNQPATTITMSQQSLTLERGTTATISASVGPEDANDKTATWSSTNPDVATVDNGIVTAVGAGECDIVATTHNGLTASCHVTVVVNPDGITLDATSKEIYLGETFTLTATVSPDDATDKTVTWASSNNDIASVDANGQVTTKWVGDATITATTINGLAATCNVKVQPVLVESIALSQTSIEGNVGTEVALTATISPTNATYKNVTWSSDNPDVASINESGVVSMNGIGTTAITATASNGVYAICQVNVLPILVESIELSQTNVEAETGSEMQLTAVVMPETATDKTIVWSSSDPHIATVDNSGKITILAIGSATITATAADGGGVCTTCEISAIAEVGLVMAEGKEYHVFTDQGMLLKSNATMEDIGMLQQGVYIISDGKHSMKIRKK